MFSRRRFLVGAGALAASATLPKIGHNMAGHFVVDGDSISAIRDGVAEADTYTFKVAAALGKTYVNASVQGSTDAQILARVDGLLAAEPACYSFMTENATWPPNEITVQQSEATIRAIIEKVLRKGIPCNLTTPPPIWNPASDATVVAQMAIFPAHMAMQERVARDYRIGFADAHGAILRAVHYGQTTFELGTSDAWHPRPVWHTLIANEMLLPQNRRPFLGAAAAGASPPPPGEGWALIHPEMTPSGQSGWGSPPGYTGRTHFAPIINTTDATRARITVQAGDAGAQLTAIYFGRSPAGSLIPSGAQGFIGAPVLLAENLSLAPLQDQVFDIAFAWQNSHVELSAFNTSGAAGTWKKVAAPVFGVSAAWISGNDVANDTPSGYTESSSAADFAIQVEAYFP